MEMHILQTLEYLAFEGVPDGGIEVDDYVRLGTGNTISKELIAKRFQDVISKREGEEIAARPSFLFNLSRLPEPTCTELIGKAYTRNFLVRSQVFLLALWLIRDNCGNSGTAFFYVTNDDGSDNGLSERHSDYYFTAECTLVSATFTRTELDRAIAFARQLDTIIPKVARALEAGRPTGLLHASRLARCLYFTQAARGADDPAVKAAFYCMCFETLFSTDRTQISRRVSQRTALFVGDNDTEVWAIHDNIRELYDFRSTVVHGSPIGDEGALRAGVILGDACLRTAILKILNDPTLLALFNQNDESAVREFFTRRPFPTEHARPPVAKAAGPRGR